EIQNWCESSHVKGNELRFTFSRLPQRSTLRVLISHSSKNFKLEMKEGRLFFQMKQRRLAVNVEKFLIRTAYQGKKLYLDIGRDPALEYRFLNSTLRQFTMTKHPAFYTRVLR